MKTKGIILAVIAAMGVGVGNGWGASNEVSGLLQKGLFEEEANRNLDAAIRAYEAVIAQTDKDRQFAATAIFRLGECYRKQGKISEANAQYQRIVREFTDQRELVTLSRQQLGGAAGQTSDANATEQSRSEPASANQIAEIKKLDPEKRRVAVQQMFPNPVLNTLMEKMTQAEQELAMLKSNFGAQHPDVQAKEALLKTICKQVDDQVDGVLSRSGVNAGQSSPGVTASDEEKNAALNRKREEDKENSEIERLKTLLKDSPDRINAQGQNGRTPLFDAVNHDQLGVAKFLLDQHANTEVRDHFFRTPLIEATTRGNKEMVELLLQHGADANAAMTGQQRGSPYEGKTALHHAVENGYKGVAEALLAHGANVDAKNGEGKTSLHLATEKGYKSIAELLLAHGANIEARRETGATPLLEAAYAENKAIVELLVANHADVNATDNNGDSALYMTADVGNAPIADLLLSAHADVDLANKRGTTSLMEAVAQNRTDVAELLLRRGANVKAQQGKFPDDSGGWTALHEAIDKSNLGIAQGLIAKGTDVDVVGGVWASSDLGSSGSYNFHDFTPLMMAVSQGKMPFAELLIEHKADVNFRNGKDETPLLAAVKKASDDMVKLLLDHKADVKVLDKDGWSLLQHAVVDRHPDIAEILLKHGADPNLPFPPQAPNSSFGNPDLRGLTPLVQTMMGGGDVAMARLLLDHGADVNVATAANYTALHLALIYRAPRGMIELLLAHGADVNTTDKRGNTPLDSFGNNTNEISEMLRQHGAIRGLERGTIRIRRGEQMETVFWRDANGYNRHTLYEVLGALYPGEIGITYMTANTHTQNLPGLPALNYPDFAHIRIVQVANKAVSGLRTNFVTFDSLATALNNGDCSPNMQLKWGDVVELPEMDHNVSEGWQGLSAHEKETLKKCLERHVKIIVKGRETRLTLTPDIRPIRTTTGDNSEMPIFWLSDVVRGARVILASSDVTRIKVKRAHPVSGKPQEMMFDLNKIDTHSDLWLEDGDVIEIPEKAGE